MFNGECSTLLCFLLQPRHPVEQVHEFGVLRTVQLPTDAVGHVEPSLVTVFVGDDQMEGLHHQLFVFVQRPGEYSSTFMPTRVMTAFCSRVGNALSNCRGR